MQKRFLNEAWLNVAATSEKSWNIPVQNTDKNVPGSHRCSEKTTQELHLFTQLYLGEVKWVPAKVLSFGECHDLYVECPRRIISCGYRLEQISSSMISVWASKMLGLGTCQVSDALVRLITINSTSRHIHLHHKNFVTHVNTVTAINVSMTVSSLSIRKINNDSLLYLLLHPSKAGAVYCDQSVSLSVRQHISGTAGPILNKIFCADPLWPWLSNPLAALRYVMYFRFMDDVIFGRSGLYDNARKAEPLTYYH